MKTIQAILFFLLFTLNAYSQTNSWIRINQIGYLEKSIKAAVFVTKSNVKPVEFCLKDALTDKVVYDSKTIKSFGEYGPFKAGYRLDFSPFEKSGAYYIEAAGIKSPSFRIANDVYNGAADFLLNYMRQQRCGYNPFLKDSCHVHDGFIIYHPSLDSTHIDVTGGWHDASDYLQYTTTSANATFQMLFAYQQNPESFGDFFDADGIPGANGIPDILDEAKWGLDWLIKMNPEAGIMFNQIADDRDHAGFRLPNHDSVNYGKGLERPVYFCTGEPQGVFQNKNRADGIASTAGKFASAFALASVLLKNYYPEFSESLIQKSVDAYEFGKANPGVCQTAPCRSPYFYEEDNYVDDMQLAAAKLYNLLNDEKYFDDAVEFGKQEPTTPWMGADTSNHYQWYPFLNLGHYYLSSYENSSSPEFLGFMKEGLEKIRKRGENNPFLIGIPFIWCSNNLVAAALTQARLYFDLTGDSNYLEMEAALCDWLFGCNPWGTSMIIGLPKNGIYPKDPHSSLWHLYNYELTGGLVDGPVYASIFNRLKGLTIYNGDEYEEFQSSLVVYHDDYGDYSTNEPTMDGTASLTYYLSALQKLGSKEQKTESVEKNLGAVIRKDTSKKEIYLVFTGGDYCDGGKIIADVLINQKIKASFFFTGDFYRNDEFKPIIKRLKNEGHYLGPHSDKHLLYADWSNRDSLLVSHDEFLMDLKNNYLEMEKFGIEKEDARFFIPPYEWYNETIAEWCTEAGVELINFTPGTSSNADYTTPDMGNRYLSSEAIFNRIMEYEKKDPNGLNGFILLIHIGTHPSRTDKFYNKLDELIIGLKEKGYLFRRF